MSAAGGLVHMKKAKATQQIQAFGGFNMEYGVD